MPMAGIAGVVVSPEYRGRGVGTGLMSATAVRGRELGFPVSALYPATVPVYRRTGWEIAGVQTRNTITTRLLRELRGERREVREVGPRTPRMLGIMREQYAAGRVNGPRDYDRGRARRRARRELNVRVHRRRRLRRVRLGGKDIVVYQLVAGSARRPSTVGGGGLELVGGRAKVHAYVVPTTRSTSCSANAWSRGRQAGPVDAAAARRRGRACTRGYPVESTSRCRWCSRMPCSPANRWPVGSRCGTAVGALVVDAASRPRGTRCGSARTASPRCTPAPRRRRCGSGLSVVGQPALLGCLDARSSVDRRTCSTTSKGCRTRRRPRARDDAARGRSPRRSLRRSVSGMRRTSHPCLAISRSAISRSRSRRPTARSSERRSTSARCGSGA